MSFATPLDLLQRSNARRLAQLAVPADDVMPPLEAMRAALEGVSLASFSAPEQASVAKAMTAIGKALEDADALIVSYGVPVTLQSSAITRIACTLAMYYLQGAERLTEFDEKAYNACIKLLRDFASGVISFGGTGGGGGTVPATSDALMFTSASSRYGYPSAASEEAP